MQGRHVALIVAATLAANGSAVTTNAEGEDWSSFDRAIVANALYRDCSGEGSQFFYADEVTYPVPTPEREEFCRCSADYLSELLTDPDIQYVMTYRAATLAMLEKEKRAKEMCGVMVNP